MQWNMSRKTASILLLSNNSDYCTGNCVKKCPYCFQHEKSGQLLFWNIFERLLTWSRIKTITLLEYIRKNSNRIAPINSDLSISAHAGTVNCTTQRKPNCHKNNGKITLRFLNFVASKIWILLRATW